MIEVDELARRYCEEGHLAPRRQGPHAACATHVLLARATYPLILPAEQPQGGRAIDVLRDAYREANQERFAAARVTVKLHDVLVRAGLSDDEAGAAVEAVIQDRARRAPSPVAPGQIAIDGRITASHVGGDGTRIVDALEVDSVEVPLGTLEQFGISPAALAEARASVRLDRGDLETRSVPDLTPHA